VFEIAGQQATFGTVCAELVKAHGGAALLIDYGRDRPEAGDTLQALIRHQKVDPLSRPGEADVTMWADFPAVMAAALKAGADVTGCRGQGDFLRSLGIEARAARLSEGRPEAGPVIARQLDRLTGSDQMGTLFKAACVFWPRSLEVPGF
jgi:SAM-dependent MidA family methyltransferase